MQENGTEIENPILRVQEATGWQHPWPKASVQRTFSVVSRESGTDPALIAAALDPQSGVRIPTPGSPHPTLPGWIARPPMIFPIGFREAGGVLTRPASRFFNVLVRYVPASAMDNDAGQTPATARS